MLALRKLLFLSLVFLAGYGAGRLQQRELPREHTTSARLGTPSLQGSSYTSYAGEPKTPERAVLPPSPTSAETPPKPPPESPPKNPREVLRSWPEGQFVDDLADVDTVSIPSSATAAELQRFVALVYPTCRAFAAEPRDIGPKFEAACLAFVETCWEAADRVWPGREEPLRLLPHNRKETVK